jgi:hypothetical protein
MHVRSAASATRGLGLCDPGDAVPDLRAHSLASQFVTTLLYGFTGCTRTIL